MPYVLIITRTHFCSYITYVMSVPLDKKYEIYLPDDNLRRFLHTGGSFLDPIMIDISLAPSSLVWIGGLRHLDDDG